MEREQGQGWVVTGPHGMDEMYFATVQAAWQWADDHGGYVGLRQWEYERASTPEELAAFNPWLAMTMMLSDPAQRRFMVKVLLVMYAVLGACVLLALGVGWLV